MSLAGGAGQLQQSYEAGKSSYPRTDDRGWTAELDAGVVEYAARWQLATPQPVGGFDPAGIATHPAVTPTGSGWESVERDVPEWMLSESARMLLVLCDAYHARRTLNTPVLDGLPQWASNLPWASVTPQDAAGIVVSYDAQQVAFAALVEHELARPSTVVEHAVRAVANGLVDAHGITDAGKDLLESAPAELTPELSRTIETDLTRRRAEPAQHIEAALAAAPGLEPRMRMSMRAYQKGEPVEPTGPTVAELIAEYLQERDRARDEAQVRAAALPATRERGPRPDGEWGVAQMNGDLEGWPAMQENRDTPPCETNTATADTAQRVPESTPDTRSAMPEEHRPQRARLGL